MPYFKTSTGFDIFFDHRDHVFQEPTFFIHGNLASRRWWIPTAKALGQNQSAFSSPMICADFRGCGLSSEPQTEKDIHVEKFAEDFIELLKAQSTLKGPIQLVGHSTGGLVALVMMLKEPKMFSKAILLDPVGPKGISFNPAFDEAMAKAFEAMKNSREVTAQVIGGTIHGLNFEDEFFDWVIVEDGFRAAKKVGGWVVKSLYGIDYSEALRSLNQPIRVFHGSEDKVLPMTDSKELAALLPQGKFETLEGFGHCLNMENPKRMAQLLREYLK